MDDALLDETFETMTYGEEKDLGIGFLTKVARHECGHALISSQNTRRLYMGQIVRLVLALCKIELPDLFTGCSAIDARIMYSAP